MLFEKCHAKNRTRSLEHHLKYFTFRSKIHLDHPVLQSKTIADAGSLNRTSLQKNGYGTPTYTKVTSKRDLPLPPPPQRQKSSGSLERHSRQNKKETSSPTKSQGGEHHSHHHHHHQHRLKVSQFPKYKNCEPRFLQRNRFIHLIKTITLEIA